MKPVWTPRPYQPGCVDAIVEHPRYNLWAPPGMGKTSTVLCAIDILHLLGALTGPVLILAPLRVARDTWPAEVAKWQNFSHLTVSTIVGTLKQREAACARKADIYTANYEQIPWLIGKFGENWPFEMIVADESTKLKGFRLQQGGRRAGLLGKVAHLPQVKRFVCLTGTPSPNGLGDLWGQNWFIDKGHRLGNSFAAFTDRWFYRKPSGGGVAAHFGKLTAHKHANAEIQERLKDVTQSLDPKDWFDLKEPVVTTVKVKLPEKARAIYRDLENQMFAELEDSPDIEAFNAAALTMKCLQIASGAVIVKTEEVPPRTLVQHIHDEKLNALESIVEESNVPVLVAYNFVSDRVRILKHFGENAVDISTKAGMAKFMSGEARVGVAHPKSVGHGVDGLQNVTNVLVRFGHDWNLEERLQMLERIGPTRQAQAGHDRPVLVYDIVAEDTVDEDVIERHRSKREIQDVLMASMKRHKGIFSREAA